MELEGELDMAPSGELEVGSGGLDIGPAVSLLCEGWRRVRVATLLETSPALGS